MQHLSKTWMIMHLICDLLYLHSAGKILWYLVDFLLIFLCNQFWDGTHFSCLL